MYPKQFEKLVECLRNLPGVGLKTAERYAFQILEWDEDKINEANSAKAMNNDTKTAEIVKFPGFRNEASKEENLKDAQSTESSAEEIRNHLLQSQN